MFHKVTTDTAFGIPEDWSKQLVDRYGLRQVRTQFDPGYPTDVFKAAGTWPDLYVIDRQLFIEVKSRWTLLNSLKSNRQKARKLDEAAIACRWVVVKDGRSSSHVKLPRDWYTWPQSRLEKFVT
jgi:hypothetical protein